MFFRDRLEPQKEQMRQLLPYGLEMPLKVLMFESSSHLKSPLIQGNHEKMDVLLPKSCPFLQPHYWLPFLVQNTFFHRDQITLDCYDDHRHLGALQ